MLGLRAVASLASDSGMFAFGLYVKDVCVAGFAGFVSGVNDGQGGSLRDCVAAIMSIFPKAARDGKGSNAEEGQGPQHKQGCNAEQMFSVLHDRDKRNFKPRDSHAGCRVFSVNAPPDASA
jgi:hypothetical protein